MIRSLRMRTISDRSVGKQATKARRVKQRKPRSLPEETGMRSLLVVESVSPKREYAPDRTSCNMPEASYLSNVRLLLLSLSLLTLELPPQRLWPSFALQEARITLTKVLVTFNFEDIPGQDESTCSRINQSLTAASHKVKIGFRSKGACQHPSWQPIRFLLDHLAAVCTSSTY